MEMLIIKQSVVTGIVTPLFAKIRDSYETINESTII
jgi:hypothetical protein